MRSRKLPLTIVAIVLLIASGYAASPYVSFWRFREALRTADRDAIASHVDFPAVRESLKRELHARFFPNPSADKPKKKDRLRAMLESAAPTLIDTLVDAYVTPDGIIALLADPAHSSHAEAAAESKRSRARRAPQFRLVECASRVLHRSARFRGRREWYKAALSLLACRLAAARNRTTTRYARLTQ